MTTTRAHSVTAHSAHANRVKEGRKLLMELGASVKRTSGIQWRLGDLAIEEAGPAQARSQNRDDDEGKLSAYVKEVHGDYNNFASYRRVSTAFPVDARQIENMPWTCFREFASRDDRQEQIEAFAADCVAKGVKPSLRLAQEWLGKSPTSEFSSTRAESAARQAFKKMPEERREAVITEVVNSTSVPVRQELLRHLIGQPEVLDPVVNDRGGKGVSTAETAFFKARAPYVAKAHMDMDAARKQSREAIQQGKLESPGLTNQRMIDTMDNRIRNDAQNYQQLSRDIGEPVLQAHASRLEASRVHLEMLRDAVQACIDALPESPELPGDTEMIIDAVVSEKLERFAFAAATAE